MVGLPFLKKKDKDYGSPGKGYIPVDRVREMASRGFSEPEMIDVLRRESFSAEEIDHALTQALRIGVSGDGQQTPALQPVPQPEEQKVPEKIDFDMPEIPTSAADPDSEDAMAPMFQSMRSPNQYSEEMPQLPETSLPDSYVNTGSEEYIEYIVQNRTSELEGKIKEIQDKFNDFDKKVNELGPRLQETIDGRLNAQQQNVSGTVENVNRALADMESRISSLERAFKETLPALITSVRSLSDLVQKMRQSDYRSPEPRRF